LVYEFKTFKSSIPAEKIKTYNIDIEKIKKNIDYPIIISDSKFNWYYILYFLGIIIFIVIIKNIKNILRYFKSRLKAKKYNHKCLKCGITDISDSAAEFRYCDDCSDIKTSGCYCLKHINDHEHIK
jgi:hypothetical protein